MRYQGGKERISKQVAEVLRGQNESDTFVSLFCGTCSIESKLNCYNKVICNDIHPYLIAMLKGTQGGYRFPDTVTEEEWKYARENKDADPVMTGFIGFGCSFGGGFFQGYARDKKNPRNYALATKNSLEKLAPKIKDFKFLCMDYRDVPLPDGCVVYCDPPYDGTKEYAGIKFDSNAFWDYMREISQNHLVFISELNAPDDFIPIWEKKVTRTLDVNKNNMFKSTEKIFVFNK